MSGVSRYFPLLYVNIIDEPSLFKIIGEIQWQIPNKSQEMFQKLVNEDLAGAEELFRDLRRATQDKFMKIFLEDEVEDLDAQEDLKMKKTDESQRRRNKRSN